MTASSPTSAAEWRLTAHRTAQPPAVAARQDGRLDAARAQPPGDLAHHRRLARAAEREIADPDHRRAGIGRTAARQPPRGRPGPQPGERRQQRAGWPARRRGRASRYHSRGVASLMAAGDRRRGRAPRASPPRAASAKARARSAMSRNTVRLGQGAAEQGGEIGFAVDPRQGARRRPWRSMIGQLATNRPLGDRTAEPRRLEWIVAADARAEAAAEHRQAAPGDTTGRVLRECRRDRHRRSPDRRRVSAGRRGQPIALASSAIAPARST